LYGIERDVTANNDMSASNIIHTLTVDSNDLFSRYSVTKLVATSVYSDLITGRIVIARRPCCMLLVASFPRLWRVPRTCECTAWNLFLSGCCSRRGSKSPYNWWIFWPIYIGWSDVSESMVTIRSAFCGYDIMRWVKWQRFIMLFLSNWTSWFKKMSIWSLTYQQRVFKRYLSGKHFSEFLPTGWRQKSSGIDMEQNYVTVTLCVSLPSKQHFDRSSHFCMAHPCAQDAADKPRHVRHL